MAEGFRKVAATGGVPVQMTKPDAARGEISHSNPAFLNGEAIPYLQTEFGESDGRLSPDERWMI